jgi:hypothetical protein
MSFAVSESEYLGNCKKDGLLSEASTHLNELLVCSNVKEIVKHQ